MAALNVIYEDVNRIGRVAAEAVDVNYNSDADLGEQAERLEVIAELAARSAKLARAVNKALGG